ncbi:hypothetical protein K435DRAFT_679192 [Dendrothele bispora CBS 962.96]|uniref:Uncharacterized protein n=1 Tax=Dendrothele bispora (strain CBS 962.96) TaxID=1314807 RepID=A0A4S8LI59_DENBC|nr:hypothetical protein K435DRAFT_679192 [Dendrothele bispora CBS 962.96]
MNETARAPKRRRNRTVWTYERLIEERALNLGCVLDPASRTSYSSAADSYIQFCQWHNLPFEPTPDTLSLYVAYSCHFINPRSVRSYLSGICNELEAFYPNIRAVRKDTLVQKTLKGALKRKSSHVNRERALQREDLTSVHSSLSSQKDLDSLLFLAILFTAFFALMRLGELVWPVNVSHRELRKVTMRSSVILDKSSFSSPCLSRSPYPRQLKHFSTHFVHTDK